MSPQAELEGVVARGAMRFVDERARLSRCRVAVYGQDGAPIAAGEGPPVREAGDAASCPVTAWGRVLGHVVASADGSAESGGAAREVAAHGAAVLSELCAREREINDLSREILGGYEELNLFYGLAGELAGASDADAVCRVALSKARRVIGAKGGRVLLADGAGGTLRVATAAEPQDVGRLVAADAGRAGAAFASREAETIDDVRRRAASDLTEFERGATSLVTVPLCVAGDGDRAPLGVLQLRDKEGGAPFTAGDLKLAQAVAGQAAAVVRNSRLVGIEREMRIARTIQRRLLPGAPPNVRGLDVAGVCVPASHVGGDYYDHVACGPASLAFVVADVSGHDLAAALMQTAARAAFRAAAQADASPGEVMRRAGRALRDDLARAEMFLTAWFGRIDAATGTLSYCDAGHNPAILWRAATGATSRLGTSGIPIGVGDDEAYDERSVALAPGDVVVAYTDGVTEACAGRDFGRAYGEERLAATVAGAAHLPAAEIVRAVLDDVARFAGEGAAGDDRTLVVVRRLGTE